MNDAPDIKHINWNFLKNMTLRFPSLPGSLMQCLLIGLIYSQNAVENGDTQKSFNL